MTPFFLCAIFGTLAGYMVKRSASSIQSFSSLRKIYQDDIVGTQQHQKGSRKTAVRRIYRSQRSEFGYKRWRRCGVKIIRAAMKKQIRIFPSDLTPAHPLAHAHIDRKHRHDPRRMTVDNSQIAGRDVIILQASTVPPAVLITSPPYGSERGRESKHDDVAVLNKVSPQVFVVWDPRPSYRFFT